MDIAGGSFSRGADSHVTTPVDDVGVVVAPSCGRPTSWVTIAANLSAQPGARTAPWDPADPYAQANYVTVETIYDAVGQEHTLGVVFLGGEGNDYEYHAIVDPYVGVPAATNGTEVSSGKLSFTTDGALDAVTIASAAPVRFDRSSPPQTIAVDFGTSIADGGDGVDATISVHAATQIAGIWQDGGACDDAVVVPGACRWPMPRATTRLAVSANLDARMDIVPVLPDPWNAANPFSTSNFTISANVYDSLGARHDLGLYFRRTALGTWDYHAVLDETEAAFAAQAPVEAGTGTLDFDPTGELLEVTTKALLTLSFPGATPDQVVALDFGATTANATGAGHMTELAGASTALPMQQDGRALSDGVLVGATVCN
jgi:flagellar hook protein FlgE